MGLQDRDYMKQQGGKQNQRTTNKNTSNTLIKNLLITLIGLIVMWYGSDKIYYRMQDRHQEIKFHPETILPGLPHEQQQQEQQEQQQENIPSGISLKADNQGHFRGTLLINNIPMPFMIDTGATQTAIPIAMANRAKLPIGEIGRTVTANGLADNLSTQIESLKLGNAEIKNTKAIVLYKLDEVLIGMSTLKLFSMFIKNNTMTLMASSNLEETNAMNSELQSNKPQKVVKNWKKM
jgi:aspartyl protease family protein